jgi:hypothetical protein
MARTTAREVHGWRWAALGSAFAVSASMIAAFGFAAHASASPRGVSAGAEATRAGVPGRTRSVTTHRIAVTSSTGRRLFLTVHAFWDGQHDSRVEVSLQTRHRTEEHTWSFDASGHAPVHVTSDGSGVVHLLHQQLGGFGRINLSVQPAGQLLQRCDGRAIGQQRRVAVHGAFVFNTRSSGRHRWGSVGRADHSVRFSRGGTFTNARGCSTAFPCPAQQTLYWGMDRLVAGAPTSIRGTSMAGTTKASGHRLVFFAGAGTLDSRRDFGRIAVVKPPTLHVQPRGNATLTVFAHGGAATIDATHHQTTKEACGSGVKQTQRRVWSGGDFTNGKHPIRIPMQIFGPIQVTTSAVGGGGYFEVDKAVP